MGPLEHACVLGALLGLDFNPRVLQVTGPLVWKHASDRGPLS